MLKKFLHTLTFILIAISVTSCTTVHRAGADMDAKAKLFKVENGKSNIYIYRDEASNINTTMAVDIDGKHAGDTEQKTYIVKSVEPGKHAITAHGENTSEIEITAEKNKNHFVWLEVDIGAFIPRAELHSVSEEKGRAGVEECKLVE